MHQGKTKEDPEKQVDECTDNKINESDQRSQDQEKIYWWRGKYYDAQDGIKQLENKIKELQGELQEYEANCKEEAARQEQLQEEKRQLQNQLEKCETTHKAETERLKEEHARELNKKTETFEEQLLKKDKEIRKRENKIEDLYRDLDELDGAVRRYQSENKEQRDLIHRLKTQTMTLRDDVRKAEEYANEQKSRRKDVHYDLCAALDDKDRLQRRIDALHDDIKELKDENRGLRHQNRNLQNKLERTKPRLEYSLVLARCLHQSDPSLLSVAEMLRDGLVREGDRVDVKIKEAEHITPQDGVLLVIGTRDKIKQSLQQLHPGVPFVVLVLHPDSPAPLPDSPAPLTTPGKLGVTSLECVEVLDVVEKEGVLHSTDPSRPVSEAFREVVRGQLAGQQGLDIGGMVSQVSSHVSSQTPTSLAHVYPRQWIFSGIAVVVCGFLAILWR